MALLSAEHLAGPGYIILNVVRAMNIITLLAVVSSSVVMLVKTFIVSKFFFFDATSHVVTALVGLFLVISECSLFRGYFARNWPLLSPSHGFIPLGCAMMVLGLNMLGNMNKEATSQQSLSLPFWRLLVASGILAIIIGFFNVVVSYVFRDKSRHITARRVRSHGAITLSENGDLETGGKAFSINTHHTGSSASRTGTPAMRMGTPPVDMGSPLPEPSPQKEGRFSQFNFSSPARLFRNARNSVLPSYHSASPLRPFHSRASSTYSRSTSGEARRWPRKKRESSIPRMPLEISAPLNVNPQFAHLVKPNLAHHPSQRRAEENDSLKF
ncbi:hypothetical protein BDV96DRAFT_597496 [Lophiotrema nucula]|uniref:DUF7598 domain-containing protein n=1 Tax=Lophiotrema nucula TaxID=690887 RepID=A0A6A5ZDG5_9PLEO|nr:hypothetical protein BDV96DRAFT_597496 [Lophiotrema nucula]